MPVCTKKYGNSLWEPVAYLLIKGKCKKTDVTFTYLSIKTFATSAFVFASISASTKVNHSIWSPINIFDLFIFIWVANLNFLKILIFMVAQLIFVVHLWVSLSYLVSKDIFVVRMLVDFRVASVPFGVVIYDSLLTVAKIAVVCIFRHLFFFHI